jgi:hypothetical protein
VVSPETVAEALAIGQRLARARTARQMHYSLACQYGPHQAFGAWCLMMVAELDADARMFRLALAGALLDAAGEAGSGPGVREHLRQYLAAAMEGGPA